MSNSMQIAFTLVQILNFVIVITGIIIDILAIARLRKAKIEESQKIFWMGLILLAPYLEAIIYLTNFHKIKRE